MPNTGSHTVVWTLETTAHTDRKGYITALTAAGHSRSQVRRLELDPSNYAAATFQRQMMTHAQSSLVFARCFLALTIFAMD